MTSEYLSSLREMSNKMLCFRLEFRSVEINLNFKKTENIRIYHFYHFNRANSYLLKIRIKNLELIYSS